MRKILDLESNSEKWSSSSYGQSNNIVDTYACQRIHKQKKKKYVNRKTSCYPYLGWMFPFQLTLIRSFINVTTGLFYGYF